MSKSRWQDTDDADDDDSHNANRDGLASQQGHKAQAGGAGTAEAHVAAWEAEAAHDGPRKEPERRDMLSGCRSREESFDLIKDIGAGTYGLVSKCASPCADNQHARNVTPPPKSTCLLCTRLVSAAICRSIAQRQEGGQFCAGCLCACKDLFTCPHTCTWHKQCSGGMHCSGILEAQHHDDSERVHVLHDACKLADAKSTCTCVSWRSSLFCL